MRKPYVVFSTDFGLKDGAVCSMYGVVKSIDPEIEMFNLTHEVTKFCTWTASYRLWQSMAFWPKGTIFVSVVDPGVGTPPQGVRRQNEQRLLRRHSRQRLADAGKGEVRHRRGP